MHVVMLTAVMWVPVVVANAVVASGRMDDLCASGAVREVAYHVSIAILSDCQPEPLTTLITYCPVTPS